MCRLKKVQLEAINKGADWRLRLVKVTKRAVKNIDERPTYIYSPPGLGKTYTVSEEIKKAKVPHYTFSSNNSMFGLGVRLATIAYLDKSKHIIINVDDCDELLKNEQNINILKNMLEGSKCYTYNKSMTAQIANLNQTARKAIKHFSSPKQLGFSVPTDRFTFIFTSNMQLPFDDEVEKANAKGRKNAVLIGHKNAIRSRCHTNDFDMKWDVQWGWISDVVLNTNVLNNLRKKEKNILLDWMYCNWDDMTEHSIRTAEKMASVMVDDPTGYITDWEIDFLK